MSVLVLVAPGSEEIETVAIVDTLVRGGIDVVLASCCPTGARQILASRGVQLVADCHLDELTTRDFDAMVVPGGLPGSEVIRDTPLAIDLLREQADLGRWRADGVLEIGGRQRSQLLLHLRGVGGLAGDELFVDVGVSACGSQHLFREREAVLRCLHCFVVPSLLVFVVDVMVITVSRFVLLRPLTAASCRRRRWRRGFR